MSEREESDRVRLERRVSALGEAIEAGRTAEKIRDTMRALGMLAAIWQWPGLSHIYACAIVDAWDRHRQLSHGDGLSPDLATMEAARQFVAKGRAVLAAQAAEEAQAEEAQAEEAQAAKDRIAALRSVTVDMAAKSGTVSEAIKALRGFGFDAIFFVPMSGKGWICDMRDTIGGRQASGQQDTQASALIQAAARMIEEVRGDVKPTGAARPATEEAAEAQTALKDAKAVVIRLLYCFRVLQATESAILSARALEDALGECLRGVGLELVLAEESRPNGSPSRWHWEVRVLGEDEIDLEMRGTAYSRDQAAIVAVRHIRGKASRAIEELCAPFVGAKEDK